MAINFNEKKNETKVIRDNEVKFCGLKYMLSDDEAKSLKKYIDDMLKGNVKSTASAPTTITEEEKEWKEVPRIGKEDKAKGNDYVTITKKGNIYRAYVEYGTMKKLAKSEKSYKQWKKYMHSDLFKHHAVVEEGCEDFHFIFNPTEMYGMKISSEQLATEFGAYLHKKDEEYKKSKGLQ